MSLAAIVNGVRYTRAKSIVVNRSIRNFVGWFEIVSSADNFNNFPIKINDDIQIIAGFQTPLLKGTVERLSISQGPEDHVIIASGRDITSTLVDSSLKTKQFKGPISFDGLVNRVMSEQGTIFPLIVATPVVPQIPETELVSAQIGETAFDFLDRYARRVQLILTTDEQGQVKILRAGRARISGIIQNVPGLPLNNVLTSSLDIDFSERYNEYVCRSQIAPAGLKSRVSTRNLVNQSASAKDTDVIAGRFLEFEAETAMDSSACQGRVDLEANVRKAKSFDYRAVLQGALSDIKTNTLVAVRDAVLGINSSMLVTNVNFSFELGSGTTTEVRATLENSFNPQIQEESSRGSVGGAFIK